MNRGSKWTISDLSPLKFNCIVVGITSCTFFLGWWAIIDANLQYTRVFDAVRTYHLPGILATLSMICVNMVPAQLLYDSFYYTGNTCCTPFLAKGSLFVFLVASFGCLIAAAFILVHDFMLVQERYQYPGYIIFVQNLCIFVSNMMLRFGRKRDV